MPLGLLGELETLGLSPYEARVVVGLLRLSSANTLQLATLSRVPRTSIYQVLDGLSRKGLAHRIPGEGPATWSTPGHVEVLDRLAEALAADQEEQLRQHRARSEQVRRELDDIVPDAPVPSLPYVHLVDGTAKVKATYDRLLQQAAAEVVMFTRPPYSYVLGEPNPAVLDALARGVDIRVLYEAEQVEAPTEAGFLPEMDLYHRAGVRARVVDDLPIKLVVVDRSVALIAMRDPLQPDAGFPTTLLIEHPGYARIQAEAFERLWETARAHPALVVAPPAGEHDAASALTPIVHEAGSEPAGQPG